MLKALALVRAPKATEGLGPTLGRAVLEHDERHLRRRVIELTDGRKVFVDFPETVVLAAGDVLPIEGGGIVEIAAAVEPLYVIRGRDPVHLAELAWHIGNRHLAAAIGPDRIVILRDAVIRGMLEGLGAQIEEILGEFDPLRGAYSGHGHGHSHGDAGHSAQGHEAAGG